MSEPLVSFVTDLVHLDGIAILALIGELDQASASDLVLALTPLVWSGSKEIVIDMAGLSFIDSSGLAALVAAQNELVEQGRHLTIRSARPSAMRVFGITGVMEFLNVNTGEVDNASGEIEKL